MKISDILASKEITVSCELFPPKKGEELKHSREIVRETAALSPDFISVTYGAAGTTAGFTSELADEVEKCGVTALSHLTCVQSDRESVLSYLSELKNHGICNVLALRGDIPEDTEPKKVFRYASDLAKFISDNSDFCIGGACYPEGHPESESYKKDIEALKIKAESGVSFFTTQMFFDNDILYSFLSKLRRAGVNTPVIAGIMPVVNAKQITRICSLSGTYLPRRFREIVERFADKPEAMRQAGITYASEQIIDLIANGVNNIHIYTMNHPDIAGSIMKNLSEIWK